MNVPFRFFEEAATFSTTFTSSNSPPVRLALDQCSTLATRSASVGRLFEFLDGRGVSLVGSVMKSSSSSSFPYFLMIAVSSSSRELLRDPSGEARQPLFFFFFLSYPPRGVCCPYEGLRH